MPCRKSGTPSAAEVKGMPTKDKDLLASRIMSADHERLEDLLRKVEESGHEPGVLYDKFRAGLLRHMWIEEHLMIPPALKTKEGARKHADFARLKLDHGALTALLVPVPSAGIFAAIRGIVEPHNRLEEDSGGLYEICDAASGEEFVEKMKSAPAIPLRACDDRPTALAACRRALKRAGYDAKRWLGGEVQSNG